MATFSGGQYVDLAVLLEQLVPLYVEKGSDESIANNTMQDDDELLIANIPPGKWELTGGFYAAGTSGINQDVKYGWTWTGSAELTWVGISYHQDWANSATNRDVSIEGDVQDSGSPSSARAFGTVTGSSVPTAISGVFTNSTASTLQMQWAQNTTNADDTTVKAGSWFCLRRVLITL